MLDELEKNSFFFSASTSSLTGPSTILSILSTPNHLWLQAIILLPTVRLVLSMHSSAARRSFMDVGSVMSIPRTFELLLGISIIATLLFFPRASLQHHCLTFSPFEKRMLADKIWNQVRHKCFDRCQEAMLVLFCIAKSDLVSLNQDIAQSLFCLDKETKKSW